MFSKYYYYNKDELLKPNLRLFSHIPIIDINNSRLYPVKIDSVIKMMCSKRGFLKIDSCFGYYFQLDKEVENIKNHPLILGIDLGKYYDGYTVLGKDFNFNFQDNSNEKNIKNIKLNTINKNINKRLRRNRLWHRKLNPKENKERIPYSLNFYLQKRIFIIRKFLKYFPITDIVIEKLFHNPNFNNGSRFSLLEIAQSKLIKWIENNYKEIEIHFNYSGKETYRERLIYFDCIKNNNKLTKEEIDYLNYHNEENFDDLLNDENCKFEIIDIKNKDKSIENFYSHCVDSFILSKLVLENKYDIYFDKNNLNTNLIIKQQLEYMNKRVLHKFKNKQGEKKYYYKHYKNGEIRRCKRFSKYTKIRVKPNNCKSNHLKNWEYKYLESKKKFRKFKTFYSDSIVRTRDSRYFNGKNLGKSKKWLFGNIYKNYNIKSYRS